MSDLSIFQSIEMTYIDKFLQSYFNANNYKIKKYTRYLNFSLWNELCFLQRHKLKTEVKSQRQSVGKAGNAISLDSHFINTLS